MSRDKPPSERWPMCPLCKHAHPGVEHVWGGKKPVPVVKKKRR
jgi:hypothetical protein